MHMTDRDHEFSEAFDYTAWSRGEKHASAGIPLPPETSPHGATSNDSAAVAAQLMEAACRAHEDDHEAAKAHIAHAVALLQRRRCVEPATGRLAVTAERQVTAGGLLTWQAIAWIDANLATGNSGARSPTASRPRQLDQIRLRRVLSYISTNIDDDITLADLAGIAGYSPFHFSRKFTDAVGVSPQRYITRVRLRRALVELAAAKLPLAEIALNAHFSCQASFTRAFHRATGLTPKAYQRQALAAGRSTRYACGLDLINYTGSTKPESMNAVTG
jgi:AraC-like DNA-binding protein